MLCGGQNGDHMMSRRVTLGEGLHCGRDPCAGGQGWVSVRKSRCSMVVIRIRIFLWLYLDDAGRAEAVGRQKRTDIEKLLGDKQF